MEDRRSQMYFSFPDLFLIAATRMMFGAGLAMLLGDRLTSEQRKATGWSLFIAGTAIGVPLTFDLFGRQRPWVEQAVAAQPRIAA